MVKPCAPSTAQCLPGDHDAAAADKPVLRLVESSAVLSAFRVRFPPTRCIASTSSCRPRYEPSVNWLYASAELFWLRRSPTYCLTPAVAANCSRGGLYPVQTCMPLHRSRQVLPK